MEATELTLVVQNDGVIRATTQDGAEVSSRLILDDLHRALVAIFEDWLSLNKISRRRELEVFGSILYSALFNGQVGAFFERTLAGSRNIRQRLRIQLSFEGKAADLASIPWEFLYYPDAETRRGFFLATNVDLVLSRYMPLAMARQTLAPAKGPLRILIVVSKPQDLDPVLSEEVIEAIEKLSETGSVTINILNKPTVYNLLQSLEETRPHVLHFIGHGEFNKDTHEGKIALLNMNEKNAAWIPDKDFTDYFIQMNAIPHLAFLHLCEGGKIDLKANFAGLAPQLVRAGIQAVIAMQYPITNIAAIIFSRTFYQELAKGKPVDTAVQEGRYRITINNAQAYDSRTFGTPVLYMRSRDGLIQPPANLTANVEREGDK